MHDGKRTLVLTHPALAERLLPTAERWVATWMLDPFLLIPLPDPDPQRPFDARWSGVLIGRDGAESVPLLPFLARGAYDLVRVVAVQLLHPRAPRIERDALMRTSDALFRAAGNRTRFHRINLLVLPTAERCEAPVDRLVPGWEANVVAAPENRHSVRGFDAFVDPEDPRGLEGHVLANAATAGALWVGMDAAPYDERLPVGGTSELVALQRTYARAVVMDDFLLRMARAGLRRLIDDVSPFDDAILAADGHAASGRPLPPAKVAEAADELAAAVVAHAQDGALRHRGDGAAPRQQVARHKVRPGKAVAEFLRFSGDRLLSMPNYFLWRAQQRTAARFDRILHGGEGDTEVVIGKDPIGDLAVFVRDLEEAEAEKAELLGEIDEVRPRPTIDATTQRELWQTLRRVTFGMYDGRMLEDTPEVSPMRRIQDDLRRKDLLRTMPTKSSLFPDWSETFAATGALRGAVGDRANELSPTVDWLDVEDAERWRVAIQDARAELDRDLTALEVRRRQFRMELGAVTAERASIGRESRALDDWLRTTAGAPIPSAAVARLNQTIDRLPASIREEYLRSTSPTSVVPNPPAGTATVDRTLVDPSIDSPTDPEASGAADDVPDAPGLPSATADPTNEDTVIRLAAEGPGAFGTDEAAGSDDLPVTDAASTPFSVPRPSLWRRILAWFRRRRRTTRAVGRALRCDASTATGMATALAGICNARLRALDGRLTGLREVELGLQEERAELDERVATFDGASHPFTDWFERHHPSFAWRLTERMAAERADLARGLEAERTWLASPLPVDPQEALRLFQRFVRRVRLLVLLGLILPATVQLALLTVWSEATDAARERVAASDAQTPTDPPAAPATTTTPDAASPPADPTVPDTVAGTAPAPTDGATTDVGGASSTGPDTASGAPAGTMEGSATVLDRIITALSEMPWHYLLLGVAIILLLVLLSYYRAWSRQRRLLRQLRDDVSKTRTWVRDELRERDRLSAIEEDAQEVLQLTSEFLHRPFDVPESDPFARDQDILDALSASMALSVAEPIVDDAWRGTRAFEQRIVAQQMRRGWLEDAFLHLIRTVEQVTAQPEGTFDADLIDGSPRTRQAFLEVIRQTDGGPRALAGRERERQVIREMSDWELSERLPFPDVRIIAPTRLTSVDVRRDLLDDVDPDVRTLTDFLLQNLPEPDGHSTVDPWGPWTVSVTAPNAAWTTVATVVHGAKRYERRIADRGYRDFVPLRPNEVRPVELVVRVDLAHDRPLHHLHGYDRFSREADREPPPPIDEEPPTDRWNGPTDV